MSSGQRIVKIIESYWVYIFATAIVLLIIELVAWPIGYWGWQKQIIVFGTIFICFSLILTPLVCRELKFTHQGLVEKKTGGSEAQIETEEADLQIAETSTAGEQKAQQIMAEAWKKAEIDAAETAKLAQQKAGLVITDAQQEAEQIIVAAQKKADLQVKKIISAAELKAQNIIEEADKYNEIRTCEIITNAEQKSQQIIAEARKKAEIDAAETAKLAHQKAELVIAEAQQKTKQTITDALKKAYIQAAEITINAKQKAEFKPPRHQTWHTPEPIEVSLGSLCIGERFMLGGKTFEVEGFRGNNIVKAILLKQIKHNWQRIARVDVASQVRVTIVSD